MNFIVLSHFLCVGPPRAGTRLGARWMHPWSPEGTGARPTPTEMGVQPGEHSLAKNVLSLWNPNRRKQTLLLGVLGYSVGRRIIHTTLKTGVRPQRKSGKTKLGR